MGLFTAAQFIEAIKDSGGIVTTIAQRVGCAWHTAKKYITNHPTVAQAWQDEREKLKDVAEVQLVKQVNNGEQWAVKYYLSTQAKDRGYTQRTEHTGANGKAIPVDVDHDARGVLAQLIARQSAALAAAGGDSEPDAEPSG